MKSLDGAISKYKDYMREIRYRTNVIKKTLRALSDGEPLTGYRESDIELIYLQLRQCLELMMFASLVAHYSHGYELAKKIVDKEYHARKIMAYIRLKNKKFYPKPMAGNEEKNSEGQWLARDLEDGYLTEDDFCILYDRTCGKILHAHRVSKFNDNHDKLISDAEVYTDKLIALLNVHWINITEKNSIRVIMKDSVTGDIGVNYLEYIGKVK